MIPIKTTELFILLNSNKLGELKSRLTTENVNVRGVNGQSLLHDAVGNSNLEAVGLLLDLGANVDALDRHGDTPLIYAANYYNHDIARLLLEAGADPNLKGNKSMMALRWAITGGHESYNLVRLLLQHGADPWIENDAGSHTVAYAERLDPDFAEEIKRTRPKAK